MANGRQGSGRWDVKEKYFSGGWGFLEARSTTLAQRIVYKWIKEMRMEQAKKVEYLH